MSFHLFYNTETLNNFCNVYYQNISLYGTHSVNNLFEPNACCNYNGLEYIGFNNIINKLCEHGITRIVYDGLSCTYQLLSADSMILQVHGVSRGLSTNGIIIDTKMFTETFIIKYKSDGRLYISNYMIRHF